MSDSLPVPLPPPDRTMQDSGSRHPATARGHTPLTDHLRDAIRLNRSRRPGYRRRGGWRADVLSRILVASERSLLLPAKRLDAQAARFDLPILAAQLADMTDAPAADCPLPALVRSGESVHMPFTPDRHVLRTLRSGDFDAAADALADRLHTVRQRERADRRHRALTAHVIESAGWMASRGAEYARQTDGATAALSAKLVRGHLALLPFARFLDRLAAPVHARGVGLFVNDLPAIPFPEPDSP